MTETSHTEPEFAARARRRLRAEPPGFSGPRADLRGDHAFDRVRQPTGDGIPPRLAAVLVGIVTRDDGPTVIFTERASHLRNHSGQIAFPGGKIDPIDATPLDAALREAEEEIGLDRRHVRPLGFLDAYLSATNFLVLPAVATVSPAMTLAINPREVAAVFEVPLAFLLDGTNHERHAREIRGAVREYYAMPYGDRYIWGVTAGILRNFYERLSRP